MRLGVGLFQESVQSRKDLEVNTGQVGGPSNSLDRGRTIGCRAIGLDKNPGGANPKVLRTFTRSGARLTALCRYGAAVPRPTHPRLQSLTSSPGSPLS